MSCAACGWLPHCALDLLLLVGQVGDDGLGVEQEGGDGGGVADGGEDDEGGVDDAGLEQVGAVAGGGLTVIANAPNPAGQSILKKYFKDGVSPAGILMGAIGPTLIIWLCYLFFS